MPNDSTDNYLRDVKIFVSKISLVPENKLNRNTKLERDLGITGDDAAELFELFSSRFNVDLSDLVLEKYFDNEGVGLINFAWLFGKRRKHKQSLHEITLADLENSLRNGRWIDPPYERNL